MRKDISVERVDSSFGPGRVERQRIENPPIPEGMGGFSLLAWKVRSLGNQAGSYLPPIPSAHRRAHSSLRWGRAIPTPVRCTIADATREEPYLREPGAGRG